jgi:hypothetical protein
MQTLQWLGQASDTSANAAAWEAYVRALSDDLNSSFARASTARKALQSIRERLGLPFMVEPGEGAVRTGAWDSGLEQDFLQLGSMVATLTRFADDSLAGKRKLGFDEQNQLAFERNDGDFSRVEVRNGRPVEIENATNQPVRVTGTVGVLPPIIIGIIAVAAAVTTYFVVAEVCETVENVVEQKTFETLSANQVKLVQGGATPEQAKVLTDSIYEGAAAVHVARASEKTSGKSEIPQTIRTVGFIALGLGALYIVAQLLTRRGGGGALATARMLENQTDPEAERARESLRSRHRRLKRRGMPLVGAVRYSGDAKVRIRYRDAEDDYAGTITWPGGSWHFAELRASPHWQRTHSADSAETYDELARAALSFGANENEDIYGYADTDDRGEFVVRRR